MTEKYEIQIKLLTTDGKDVETYITYKPFDGKQFTPNPMIVMDMYGALGKALINSWVNGYKEATNTSDKDMSNIKSAMKYDIITALIRALQNSDGEYMRVSKK